MPCRLVFNDLHRSFGRIRVLRGASGAVSDGQVLLATGRNGCGKSTLLRCLAGLSSVQRGTIELEVDGRALTMAERRLAVGFLSPELRLYDELTTLENLAFFARLRRVEPERPRQLLERLDLPLERLAGDLSSGMRQRLRWAFAVLHRPRVLLLDEPLQNLDAPGRRAVLELLSEALPTSLAVIANPEPLELGQTTTRLELDL